MKKKSPGGLLGEKNFSKEVGMLKKGFSWQKMKKLKRFLVFGLPILLIFSVLVGGCKQEAKTKEEEKSSELSGEVKVDGSSTVYLITEAVAEEFQKKNPNTKVTVGTSGTGGGFKKFVVGETDINDASRPIKDEERKLCEENGIEYLELKIGIDGLAVVVNSENDWCEDITIEELKKIWEPGSKVKKWSDVRPEWPKENIVLFGPDTDSGTFDFFTEKVVGEEGKSRSDYTASADDNVLVEGVAGEKYALGYFGQAYYEENKDKIRAVSINGVTPEINNIKEGKYPLSRPLFIYVNKASLKKPQVFAFVQFYLENAAKLTQEVGYVPLIESEYQDGLKILEDSKQ